MKSQSHVERTWPIVLRACLFALALLAAIPACGQTCAFNTGQPGSVSFGTINPTGSAAATFSVTLNYKCTASATAFFTVSGANDSGPGAYRLKHLTQVQYINYSISTVNTPGTRITLNGQIVATDYQNAYVGDYSDTLTVTVLP